MSDYMRLLVSWDPYPDHLFREFVIRKDMKLEEAGIVILRSFGANLESLFWYRTGTMDYRPRMQTEEREYPGMNMVGHTLSELGRVFGLDYDDTENWHFLCEVLNDNESVYMSSNVMVTAARGAGIFEYDQKSLLNLMEHPDTAKFMKTHRNPDAVVAPINMEMKNPQDFDLEIDLNDLDEVIDEIQQNMPKLALYAAMTDTWENLLGYDPEGSFEEDDDWDEESMIDPLWLDFHEYVEWASMSRRIVPSSVAWKLAFMEFFGVLDQISGGTKISFDDLMEDVDFLPDIYTLLKDGIVGLTEAEQYDDCIRILEELDQKVAFDKEQAAVFDVHKLHLYVSRDMFEKAEVIEEAWQKERPNHPATIYMHLYMMHHCEQYDEGISFIQTLGLLDAEVTDQNIFIFEEAISLIDASHKGRRLAEELRRKVREKQEQDEKDHWETDDTDDIPF